MADKRMISKKVVNTDSFLLMPIEAQALYFHLVVNADDEGFVGNPRAIRDSIRAKEEDLQLLVEKKLLIAFENGVIVIRHWKVHNTLRHDRFCPTIFIDELAKLSLTNSGVYCMRSVATESEPLVATQYSIEENSLNNVSIGEKEDSLMSERSSNNSSRFAKPTIDEIKAYCVENGYEQMDAARFYDYYESNGWRIGKTPMKDWKATVRNWVRRVQSQGQDNQRNSGEKYKREE